MLDEWTEVLGALSLATDLANGHNYEKTLRTCVLSVALAEAAGLHQSQVRAVFHTTLLRFIGCTSFAHEEALLFGDDLAARHAFATVDYRDKTEVWRASGQAVGAQTSALGRAARRGAALLRGPATLRELFASQCEVGMRFGERLGLGADVVSALGQIHERWDGEGGPAGMRGEELSEVVRTVQAANLAELVHHRLGVAGAVDVIDARRGTALDPAIADVLIRNAQDLFSLLDSGSTWEVFVSTGTRFPTFGPDHDLEAVVAAFADFSDLLTVYTLGHSQAVAQTAVAAGAQLGLGASDLAVLRRAALLHDVGRVAVSSALWEKTQPLTAADWERIRLHAYFGQRILDRAPTLRREASLACADHERCDGSGYPRAIDLSAMPPSARVLAASDVYCAMLEDRPHRPARTRQEVIVELHKEVDAGRLDAIAVHAVLGTTPKSRNAAFPAGLTAREVEVLGRVVQGDTNKEVGQHLGISPRTVGHHLANVFGKIGVTTRAAAALFAVEHGLVRRRRSDGS